VLTSRLPETIDTCGADVVPSTRFASEVGDTHTRLGYAAPAAAIDARSNGAVLAILGVAPAPDSCPAALPESPLGKALGSAFGPANAGRGAAAAGVPSIW